MLSLSELVRIYVCLAPTDMRKSFDSLAALVRDWLGYDPLVRPFVRVPQSPRRSREAFVVGPRRADVVLPAAGRRNLSLPDDQRPASAEHRGFGAGVVAGAVGHRPGQREAAEALSAHGVNARKKFLLAAGTNFAACGIYKGMSTDACRPLPDPALLPDDPAVLKQLVVQLLEELQKANARLERQEHHMHLLLRRIYGSTSEKFDPRQGVLFDAQAGAEEAAAERARCRRPPRRPVSKNRDKHGRGRIPDKIEREEVIHDLTEAEKAALGGAENLVELPPERSEQLDWRPSTLFVWSMSARNTPARSRCRRAA